MDSEKALELARVAYPNNEKLRVAYMLGLNKGYEVCKEQLMKDAKEIITVQRSLTEPEFVKQRVIFLKEG